MALTSEQKRKLWAANGDYKRRATYEQAIGYIKLLQGRMEACRQHNPGEHTVSRDEIPTWLHHLQQVLDTWPEVTEMPAERKPRERQVGSAD